MVTLTYRFVEQDIARTKREIYRFCFALPDLDKYWAAFWFMEFQKREAVHYHLYFTQKFIPWETIAETWSSTCGPDRASFAAGTHVRQISGRKHSIRYMMKYALKMEQKAVPDGVFMSGRFWGVMGPGKTSPKDLLSADRIVEEEEAERFIVKFGETASKIIYMEEYSTWWGRLWP